VLRLVSWVRRDIRASRAPTVIAAPDAFVLPCQRGLIDWPKLGTEAYDFNSLGLVRNATPNTLNQIASGWWKRDLVGQAREDALAAAGSAHQNGAQVYVASSVF